MIIKMKHLIQVQVKVLTYGGVPVEHDPLHDTIRYMNKPHIVNYTDTIESLVDHAKIMKDVNGVPFVRETYFAKSILSDCELTPCFLIDSEIFYTIRDGFISIEDFEQKINQLKDALIFYDYTPEALLEECISIAKELLKSNMDSTLFNENKCTS